MGSCWQRTAMEPDDTNKRNLSVSSRAHRARPTMPMLIGACDSPSLSSGQWPMLVAQVCQRRATLRMRPLLPPLLLKRTDS
jgi:hypothetical protein